MKYIVTAVVLLISMSFLVGWICGGEHVAKNKALEYWLERY